MRYSQDEKMQRAVLVGLECPLLGEDSSNESSLSELELLLTTAGGICVAHVLQNREAPDPKTFIGSGKAEEVKRLVESQDAQLVIMDNRLSPSQAASLEDVTVVPVLDRSMLILDIFAARAKTSEGCMQVELAQLKELLPRLSGKGSELSRLGGGIGTRGPGETKLETDRRHINRRIAKLEEALREVRRVRNTERRRRQKTGIPVVALVGYTNAGKSTILNLLTNSNISANDRLFDTLDPTTRRLRLYNHTEVLLTDTVGFIRKLPHHLIEAFKATLEELMFADIVLHVIDLSNPEWSIQAQVTERLVDGLKNDKAQVIRVYNKIDLCVNDEDTLIRDGVCMSARTGEGVDTLLQAIVKNLDADKSVVRLNLPYAQSALVDVIRREGRLERTLYQQDCIDVSAVVGPGLLARLKPFVIKENGNGG